jgi:methyltransferase family protein
MHRLANTLDAETEAGKFDVPPDIHADDFIYQHHVDIQTDADRDKARARVTQYYFFDGDRSAQRLDGLIRQYHPKAGSDRLALLEFASGYGCVSRHLRKMGDRYDLVACDIHPQAIDFLRERLDLSAVLSRSRPRDFVLDQSFDIVFALSFFSHMPDRRFGDWIEALFASLAEDGLLIFTTHGREAHTDMGRPALHPDGYWFAPVSEQRDIPTDEYGSMVATPFYVMERIARCPGAAAVFFHEAFWWGKQDLYIVRNVGTEFRPQRTAAQAVMAASEAAPPAPELARQQAELTRLKHEESRAQEEVQALRAAIDTIRRSTSWHVTRPLRALRALLVRR